MNTSVYIFGKLSSGYTLYPKDSFSDIIKPLYSRCKAPSQIAIHRDGSIMYYCYIRKLDKDDKFIGLCVAVNGCYVCNIEDLFCIFEKNIEKMARQGVFIHFVADGSLTSDLKDLGSEEEEVETLANNLMSDFEEFKNISYKLPQIDYSVAKDSVNEFCVADDVQDIIRASYTYGFTYIYKEKDFNTVRMNRYSSVLSRVNEENVKLKDINAALKNQNQKILSQKRQYKNVVILCILTVACGIGLFFMKDSLDDTMNNLESAQDDITQKSETIKTLNRKVSDLQTSLSEEQSSREKAETALSELKNSVEGDMPIIITEVEIANVYRDNSIETDYGETIYSSSSMYLKPKIKYTGIKTGEDITLNIKLYSPAGLDRSSSSPVGCTMADSFTVYSGSNTKALPGWGTATKGRWSSGSYRYEFWYGNVCLKSKSFTVH